MERWAARPAKSRQSVYEELNEMANNLAGDEKHAEDVQTLRVVLQLLRALR